MPQFQIYFEKKPVENQSLTSPIGNSLIIKGLYGIDYQRVRKPTF